jgi:hypothetical protein
VLIAVIIRLEARLLKDLAETPDHELQLLTRKGWAVAIVCAFPIGAILYLTNGKVR